MKHRIAAWALAGFLVAALWGVYFATANKNIPIDPAVSSHYPISLAASLLANLVTYALIALALETLRRQRTRHS